MQTMTDEELVALCKIHLPGETRSYEVLLSRYSEQVYRLAYRMLGHKEEAEDVTQEVFIRVYNGLKKFEGQSSFSSWLYRIATNCSLDALQKMKRRSDKTVAWEATPSSDGQGSYSAEALPGSGLNQEAAQVASNPAQVAVQNELRECIEQVFRKLERDQAYVLVMRDLEERSYEELAGTLGAGLSAIKMRIYRARLAFKELYNRLCGAERVLVSVTAHQQVGSGPLKPTVAPGNKTRKGKLV